MRKQRLLRGRTSIVQARWYNAFGVGEISATSKRLQLCLRWAATECRLCFLALKRLQNSHARTAL
jgi:hypothetical protein